MENEAEQDIFEPILVNWERRNKRLLYIKQLCHRYNSLEPDSFEEQTALLKNILSLPVSRSDINIKAPFYCDFGFNINMGSGFVSNWNLSIIDWANVSIGDRVVVGPNVVITTNGHPIDYAHRQRGWFKIQPVSIGNDVWIAANVTILPGVKIGDHSVIGAGSVVTRDIPADSLAVGNPCRVIRKIDENEFKRTDEGRRNGLYFT